MMGYTDPYYFLKDFQKKKWVFIKEIIKKGLMEQKV